MQEKNKLKVFPTPAKNYITVDYELREVSKKSILIIVDNTGKTLFTKNITLKKDQNIIDVSKFKIGNYVCFIMDKDKSILSKKFTVVK